MIQTYDTTLSISISEIKKALALKIYWKQLGEILRWQLQGERKHISNFFILGLYVILSIFNISKKSVIFEIWPINFGFCYLLE